MDDCGEPKCAVAGAELNPSWLSSKGVGDRSTAEGLNLAGFDEEPPLVSMLSLLAPRRMTGEKPREPVAR